MISSADGAGSASWREIQDRLNRLPGGCPLRTDLGGAVPVGTPAR